jgi:hypothetical protein
MGVTPFNSQVKLAIARPGQAVNVFAEYIPSQESMEEMKQVNFRQIREWRQRICPKKSCSECDRSAAIVCNIRICHPENVTNLQNSALRSSRIYVASTKGGS